MSIVAQFDGAGEYEINVKIVVTKTLKILNCRRGRGEESKVSYVCC